MAAMLKRIFDVGTGAEQTIQVSAEELASFAGSSSAIRRRLVPLDFLNLFTEAEQLAVVQAGLANAAVKLWYDKALAATYITLDDPRVEAGLGALTAAGLLSEERKLAVLAAMEAE